MPSTLPTLYLNLVHDNMIRVRQPSTTLTRFSAGSTISPWCWWLPTAASTLSSTPPSTVSSRTALDASWLLSPDNRSKLSRCTVAALFRRWETSPFSHERLLSIITSRSPTGKLSVFHSSIGLFFGFCSGVKDEISALSRLISRWSVGEFSRYNGE